MELDHLVGAVLVGAIDGTKPSRDEREFLSSVALSGVTLFLRNIPENLDDLKRLTAELQGLRPPGAPPLVMAIDQEGGRVRRIKGAFPNRGPALELEGGRTDSVALATIQSYGFEVGHELKVLGVNVNFAPVADILTEETNEAIGNRAFGRDADSVTRRAGAFLDGMQAAGVAGCLKHFPGQGHATVDTHLGRAVIDLSEDELRSRELRPFASLLSAVPMVMMSHCIYPQLCSREASRSPRVIQQLLREDMGFRGVVVSDDMNMDAIPQDEASWLEVIVEAVASGIDMVLICRHLERCRLAAEALGQEARKSRAFAARLEVAAQRMLQLRSSLFE